jgi:hypothetical protein
MSQHGEFILQVQARTLQALLERAAVPVNDTWAARSRTRVGAQLETVQQGLDAECELWSLAAQAERRHEMGHLHTGAGPRVPRGTDRTPRDGARETDDATQMEDDDEC